MRFTATVTVEMPMSDTTIAAIDAAKAVRELADPGAVLNAHDIHLLPQVARELEQRCAEGKAKLRAEMRGWEYDNDVAMFIGGVRGWSVQYQMRFYR